VGRAGALLHVDALTLPKFERPGHWATGQRAERDRPRRAGITRTRFHHHYKSPGGGAAGKRVQALGGAKNHMSGVTSSNTAGPAKHPSPVIAALGAEPTARPRRARYRGTRRLDRRVTAISSQ
jgi:hypothetical protein